MIFITTIKSFLDSICWRWICCFQSQWIFASYALGRLLLSQVNLFILFFLWSWKQLTNLISNGDWMCSNTIMVWKFNAIAGGILKKIRTSLKYLCPTEHIPSKIEVDVSKLDIEDRIFMRDIEVHSSLKLLSKNENMPICKIAPTSLGNQAPADEWSLKQIC